MFDLETNGLLHDATRIHCLALHWQDLDHTESYNDEPYSKTPKDLPMGSGYSITTGLSWLECADVIIGHNIIGFDLPIIKSLYPWLILAVSLWILFFYLGYTILIYSI